MIKASTLVCATAAAFAVSGHSHSQTAGDAAAGAQRTQMCVGCHKPPMDSEEGRKPQYWTDGKDSYGHRLFKVTMIPLEVIGTDPRQATNFYNRRADSGPLRLGIVSAGDGLTYVTQNLIQSAYRDLGLAPQQQEEWNGYRQNILRAPLAYKARPLNGVWATPPYLHNGSVPNLYELLSPRGGKIARLLSRQQAV